MTVLVVTVHAKRPELLDDTHAVMAYRLGDGPERLMMFDVDEDCR